MAYRRTMTRGGSGGGQFADNLTEVCRITSIRIRHGAYVDAIQTVWTDVDGNLVYGGIHGGGGGALSTFDLQTGEHIAAVLGRSGVYVDQLEFVTNKGRKFGPYGGGGGQPFTITGLLVGGFFGRSGLYLDQIGAFTLINC